MIKNFEGNYAITGQMNKEGEIIDFTGKGILKKHGNYYEMNSKYSDDNKFTGFMILNKHDGYSAAHCKSKVGYINIKIIDDDNIKLTWSTVNEKDNFLINGTEVWNK